MSKLPIRRCDVVVGEGSSVTESDLKGERLAVEVGVALPVLAPIPRHGLPSIGFGTFDGNRVDIPCTSNVGDENQIEVRVSIDCEPHSSFLHARDPANCKPIN